MGMDRIEERKRRRLAQRQAMAAPGILENAERVPQAASADHYARQAAVDISWMYGAAAHAAPGMPIDVRRAESDEAMARAIAAQDESDTNHADVSWMFERN